MCQFKNATGVLAAAHKSAMLTKYIFVRLPSDGGISDGGPHPATDTNMLLAAYRGGSHSTSDIFCKSHVRADMRNYYTTLYNIYHSGPIVNQFYF